MTRLIPLLVCALLAAVPVAMATTGASATIAPKKVATDPLALPSQAPTPTAGQQGAYGYRSSQWLARSVGGTSSGSASSATSAGPSASANVVITATVLPVRTIVVKQGKVRAIITNTPDRRAHTALYVVRDGKATGPSLPLTQSIWKQARQLGADARPGTGTIVGV